VTEHQRDGAADRSRRMALVSQVWTPAAPVQNQELFAGRIHQLQKVLETVWEVGQHCVLYGERGVGKTSLANIITEKFSQGMVCRRVSCDSDDTFETIWDRVLARIPIAFFERKVGFDRDAEQLTFSLAGLPGARADKAAELASFLIDNGAHGLLVIDEYDRVQDDVTKKRMADLIKNLSDNRAAMTILLVGVADDVVQLIGEHPSVGRCLRQIRLPRMSDPELREIVERGVKVVGLPFSEAAAHAIVESSRGLPHYTHLLAKHSALRAVRSDRDKVTIEEFRGGVDAAIEDAQASIKEAYQVATSSRKPSLYEEVLLAAALAPADDYGSFRPKSLEAPMSELCGRSMTVQNFFPHLAKFCSEERGPILTKVGQEKRYRYRFTDPLMKPFVLLLGRKAGTDIDGMLERAATAGHP